MDELELFVRNLDNYIKVNGPAAGKSLDIEDYTNYATNLYKSYGPFTLEEMQTTGLQPGYYEFLFNEEEKIDEEQTVEEPPPETVVPVVPVVPPTQGFVNSEIWEYEGQQHVVWQIPNTEIYMRYTATQQQLDGFYSGREKPQVQTASDDMWTNAIYFGAIEELPERVILQGENPFIGFTEQWNAAVEGQPWLKSDPEMMELWIQGLVEDRDIADYEWKNTNWFTRQSQETIDWLILSRGRDINADNLPVDAAVYRDENRVLWRNALIDAGVDGVDTIVDNNGVSFSTWFADSVTQGTTGTAPLSDTLASAQIGALADSSSGIKVATDITNWLDGRGTLGESRKGYGVVSNRGKAVLGPLYGKLDDTTLAEYADKYNNAPSEADGLMIINNLLLGQRKVLFPNYDESLTYEEIAGPWRNFSFNALGERVNETSDIWIKILQANDQTVANQLLTTYGLNNNNMKVLDDLTDNMSSSIGVQSGIVRGQR